MSYAWAAGSVDMTSSGPNSRTHVISADAFATGLREGLGRYAAACGEVVLPAGMYTPPGHRCPDCAASQVREPERDRLARLFTVAATLPLLGRPRRRDPSSAA
jgi:hypothetical protein